MTKCLTRPRVQRDIRLCEPEDLRQLNQQDDHRICSLHWLKLKVKEYLQLPWDICKLDRFQILALGLNGRFWCKMNKEVFTQTSFSSEDLSLRLFLGTLVAAVSVFSLASLTLCHILHLHFSWVSSTDWSHHKSKLISAQTAAHIQGQHNIWGAKAPLAVVTVYCAICNVLFL